MAIIPNTIYGHVASSCVSDKVYKGRPSEGYGTKSCGIITFSFDNVAGVSTAGSLKATYNVKLVPNPITDQQIEAHYNENNTARDDTIVGNDEDKIYVLGTDITTQPLIALLGRTIKIKVFDNTYSCEISSTQTVFMSALINNIFVFTLEE